METKIIIVPKLPNFNELINIERGTERIRIYTCPISEKPYVCVDMKNSIGDYYVNITPYMELRKDNPTHIDFFEHYNDLHMNICHSATTNGYEIRFTY